MSNLAQEKQSRVYPLPRKNTKLPHEIETKIIANIKKLLKEKNAVLIAHYYTDPIIQALAEETGGCVADSLDMAKFGNQHSATTLIIAGVKFMGETAKILTPNKKVLMPTLEATCSLDIECPIESFDAFCNEHPDRTVVVYANTSAAVKARADWVITSSIALNVIEHLDSLGEKFIWAPDKHLGAHIQKETGADMIMWNGSCVVHDEFKANSLRELKKMYPKAAVLVHPESPLSVTALADKAGSTSQLIKASQEMDNEMFIVATEKGIFYKMQQLSPHKNFIEAPTGGNGATCRSCANCPWMSMNSLELIEKTLLGEHSEENEIFVDPIIAEKALIPLNKMIHFSTTM